MPSRTRLQYWSHKCSIGAWSDDNAGNKELGYLFQIVHTHHCNVTSTVIMCKTWLKPPCRIKAENRINNFIAISLSVQGTINSNVKLGVSVVTYSAPYPYILATDTIRFYDTRFCTTMILPKIYSNASITKCKQHMLPGVQPQTSSCSPTYDVIKRVALAGSIQWWRQSQSVDQAHMDIINETVN